MSMRVLIAEDDSASNIFLKRLLLRWGFDIETAFDGTRAWELLQEEDAPSMAVLDWMMPGMDGLEVCRRLREKEKNDHRYTYVMMLTSRTEKEDIIAGMEAGADDYLTKPFDKDELLARLRAGQRIIELHGALSAANKRLLVLSRLDPLTGALSRNALLHDMDLAMYRASREKKSLGIAMVDFDNLKEYNQRFGRDTGDRALQESVRKICGCLRRTDCLGRWGGDEFLVILPGVTIDQGKTVCRRIRQAIAREETVVGEQSLKITASQSLAIWDGKSGIDELIMQAENTLRASRDRGNNRLETAATESNALS